MRECRSQPVNIELWFLLVSNCTSIMLIVSIILFTSAICSAKIVTSTGASVTSAITKSKRVVLDPSLNNQEQFTQSTPILPSPQDINLSLSPRYGNAKTSVIQRTPYTGTSHGSGSHAYGSVPKRPLSYVSLPNYQTESRHNLLAPYFDILNNPDAYKAARSVEKPTDASKSIASQSLQKQGIPSPSYNAFYQNKPIELTSFSDFEYPFAKLISQGVSSTAQAPVYKMSYPLSKVTADYAPSIPTPSIISSSDTTTQSSRQKDEATVDVNGKKVSMPIIQLQSNLDFSGVLPAFESQPFLLSSNYPIESDVGFKLGTVPKFNMPLQSNISPFSSPLSSFQGQVVPIQTTSNPQFPQYKGASVQPYPVTSNVPKAQGNYESLYNQPQLHFDKEHKGKVQPVNIQQNTAHPSVGTQDILNDVEIINKKNPEPHTPQLDNDDDDDDDENRDHKKYKNPDKENSSEDDDEDEREDEPEKHFKASRMESDFKPSTSYPFKEYDEKFGKYRAYSDDDDSEDEPFSSYKNYSDDDEEEEDSSSENRGEYIESPKPSRDSFEAFEEENEEEEEEEENHKEKHKEADEDSFEMPKQSKYYQKDFEQEFEESYKEELPKEEYVHVKEVPEIDSYINPSSSKRQQKNTHVKQVQESEESKNQEFRISRKNQKPKKISNDYRDSTAYGSDISAKTLPKVIYEEFFGYKKPGTEKYSKHEKTEKFSFAKKSPKEDLRAKYYKFKKPKTDSELSSENKDPYPYSSVNNWKLNKNSSEKTAPKSNIRQLSDSRNKTSFYGPRISNGRVRSITNAETFRDLTGI